MAFLWFLAGITIIGFSRADADPDIDGLSAAEEALLKQLTMMGDPAEKLDEEQVQQLMKTLLPQVAARLGLTAQQPVPFKLLRRYELKAILLKSFDRDFPPAKRRGMTIAYQQLGLFPPSIDLDRVLIDLYSKELAGFYDPFEKTLNLIAETPALEQMVTLEHELGHALQDQAFDLKQLLLAAVDNDDQELARMAVIEGDVLRLLLPEESRGVASDFPDETQSDGLLEQLASSVAEQVDQSQAPPLLTKRLIFPYTEGLKFIRSIAKQNSGMQTLRDPPRSTEQVLHPQKYEAREEPQVVPVAWLATLVQKEGWALSYHNVLGEWATRVYFELAGMPAGEIDRAASGWGGDGIFLLTKDNHLVTTWISTWDSLQDASEFQRAYVKSVERKAATSASAAGRVVVFCGESQHLSADLKWHLVNDPFPPKAAPTIDTSASPHTSFDATRSSKP